MKKVHNFLLNLLFLGIVIFLTPVFIFASENLLINPNAETGDTQGWISEPENWWVADSHMTPQDGDYLFWPGDGSIAYTKLYQDVDISEYMSDIDSGSFYLHLSGWLVNWNQYPHDRSTLAIMALDSSSQELLYLSRDHRSPSWGFYKIDSQIPIGTRILRVLMIATRYVGTNNDGHFDNLYLSIDNNISETNVSVSSEDGVSEIEVGSTIQLYATSTEIGDTEYYWSSSFESVAAVDDNGLVTTHKTGRVSIQAEGMVSNEIGYINLYVYSPDSIIIQRPQIGEKWKSGSLQNITWEVKGDVSSGTLYYSINGGAAWDKIDEINNLSSGEYSWQIPEFGTTQNDCIIKMTFSGGESVSSVFTIQSVISQECYNSNDLEQSYESGKQYCIDNPEACGVDVDSYYQSGYIDGQATCQNEAVCTQVITYAKVPKADCWVEFSTPCDVPEGWEIVYEMPSNMCGAIDDTSSENTDNCSTFDIFSNTLHVPCFDGGATMYWLDLELTGSEPVTLELKDLGVN